MKQAWSLAALMLVSLGLACVPVRQGGPAASTTPSAVVSPASQAPPAASKAPARGTGATTAQGVADAGGVVYQQQCQACHGDQGQGLVGPAVIGRRASPSKFGPTAADLQGYIQSNMPQNAPGSLSAEQYLQVTTYLLLRNDLVQPNEPIDEQRLSQIRTER